MNNFNENLSITQVSSKPTDILESQFGLVAEPGDKIECPKCGHDTMNVKSDNSIAKCFHPSCSYRILPRQGKSSLEDSISRVLEKVRQTCVRALHVENLTAQAAVQYLECKRKIPRKITELYPIGIVPEDIAALDNFFAEEITRLNNIESFVGRDEIIEELQSQQEHLHNILEKVQGWITFFYFDANFNTVSIRFRKPNTKNLRSYKPLRFMGVFTSELSSKDQDAIVVEGEFNALKLQALQLVYFEKCGKPFEGLPILAVGSVTSADLNTVRKICRKPIIIYDNDVGGAGKNLVSNACDYMTVTAVTTPGKNSDIDSYINEFDEDTLLAWRAVQDLFEKRVLYPRNFPSLQAEIAKIRDGSSKEHRLNLRVAEVVKIDMSDRAQLFYHKADTYFFDISKKRVTKIERSKNFVRFLANYGLNESETLFKYTLAHLHTETIRLGTKAQVHRFAFYDVNTFTLYLHNHDTQIYRISPDKIDLVDNGTDGVLFVSDEKSTPFIFDESAVTGERSKLDELFISRINFEDSSDNKKLNADECRILVLFWILGLFFPQIMRTKAILALIGPKGSAKTFTIKCIGKILFGDSFNVAPLNSKREDDFDAFITNSYFIGIDNADATVGWLPDKLAVLATGGAITKRTYYTTNTLEEFEIEAFAAITSRTAHFSRDDVNDRLLPLPVERLKEFKAESVLLGAILSHRDELMSEIIVLLQQTCTALRSQQYLNEGSSFRIADFGSFCMKIAADAGFEVEVKNLFAKLSSTQTNLTLDNDPLLNLLIQFLDGTAWSSSNSKILLTTADLHKNLNAFAEKNRSPYSIKSPNALGQKLKHLESEIGHYYAVTKATGAARVTTWTFSKKEGEK